jgi:hypothetical protein
MSQSLTEPGLLPGRQTLRSAFRRWLIRIVCVPVLLLGFAIPGALRNNVEAALELAILAGAALVVLAASAPLERALAEDAARARPSPRLAFARIVLGAAVAGVTFVGVQLSDTGLVFPASLWFGVLPAARWNAQLTVLNAVPFAAGAVAMITGALALAGWRGGWVVRLGLFLVLVAAVGVAVPPASSVHLVADVEVDGLGRSSWVEMLAYSPDGHLLAVGNAAALQIREAATGRLLRSLGDVPGNLKAVAFHPNSRYLAGAGTVQGEVRAWDATTGQSLFSVKKRGVVTLAFSADGRHLLVITVFASRIGAPGSLQVLDAETGAPVSSQSIPFCTLAAFAADRSQAALRSGERIAPGGLPGVMVWDLRTGQNTWELPPVPLTTGLTLSPDSRLLATGHRDEEDGAVKLWDVVNQELRFSFPTTTSFVDRLAFNADGRYLAAKTGTSEVTVWDARGGQRLFALAPTSAQAVAFSPDGTILATAGNRLYFWDVSRVCAP